MFLGFAPVSTWVNERQSQFEHLMNRFPFGGPEKVVFGGRDVMGKH
jgi:hypothetical protein